MCVILQSNFKLDIPGGRVVVVVVVVVLVLVDRCLVSDVDLCRSTFLCRIQSPCIGDHAHLKQKTISPPGTKDESQYL